MTFGLLDIWNRGDIISHAIAIILVAMSISSWAVLIYKAAQLVRMRQQGTVVARRFWQARSLDEGAALLSQSKNNPYRCLTESACEARDRHGDAQLKEALSPDEWLQRCLGVAFEEQASAMAGGLGVLASVGSTAPFVGLFGTVWGIYHALLGISAAGQSSLAQVAGPVGESLVMTALGLAVAIPAVLGYNAITRGNRSVMHKLMRFRHELHAYLMSSVRHPRGGQTKAVQPHLVVEGGK
ncbi:MotA/TolQ/ExbB proton channel family protein [Burkholderia cepacia]|uniref:MotA/TolQ/ExbB proton channel family protein n=1 Tax=Burkholderia cepacia TaxID=292 RepID=UPI002AB74EBF|nr:MotA/TolQ/ExbB proton channel family protein [Burkholderia cepacia]